MNPTKELAEYVVSTTFAELPNDVIDVVKNQVIYDGSANILAGSQEPLGKLLATYLERTTDSEQATVAGHSLTTQLLQAAFANGTFCHSMDYELMWYPPMHPTSPTLPTALALAEYTELTGKDIITAIALGFEVMARINLAERAFETDDDQFEIAHNFHSPGRLGPFGSAAVAAHLLNLDVQQTRIAFGIAGSRSSGLGANTGSMTKATHPGNAARLGLESALLAEMGWTASDSIFDAREGYSQVVHGNRMETRILTENFGDPYRMVDPGLSLKKHPAQYPTHWSIDAAINVRTSNQIDPDTIETVTVEVGADCESALQDTLDRYDSGLAGKFSIRYTVAAALLDGTVDIDSFRDERRYADDMQTLLPTINIELNPDITHMDFAETRASVSVETTDRTTYSETVERPLGIWDNPAPRDVWAEKFTDCVTRALTEEDAAKLESMIAGFDEITDTNQFMAVLSS